MSLATIDARGSLGPLRRLLPAPARAAHALWLGPDGLWDHGSPPGWWPDGRRAVHSHRATHHASFDRWCQAHPGHACGLVLSGWLLHELLLGAEPPLADDAARLACARGLLQHYHGDAAAHWSLTAWQAGGQHGVSALHAFPLQTLQASAHRHGVALRTVRPWWSVALALALQQQRRLGTADTARLLLVDGSLVTQVDLARSHLTTLAQRRLAAPSLAALAALQAGLPPVQACAALGHGLQAAADGAPAATAGIAVIDRLDGPAPARLWAGATGGAAAPAAAPNAKRADDVGHAAT